VVPFPFTDRPVTKKRPALVLSKTGFNENGWSILAMITSKDHSPWPGDSPIENGKDAGLPTPSLVRLKIFTLDNRLVLKKIGTLAKSDGDRIEKSLDKYLGG